jgi:hypothetical protein
MLPRYQLLSFLLSFLFIGFMFLSLPEKGFSGFAVGGCCQFETDQCFDLGDGEGEEPVRLCLVDDLRPGSCNEESGLCEASPSPIPTLNEWGLITVVIALGIVGAAGIVVYRRRRA